MADVEADEDEESREKSAPKRTRARGAMLAKHEAMARFVAETRGLDPRIKYSVLRARVMTKFRVSEPTAERAITSGLDLIRADFERFCMDAPRAIFDSYMDILDECMRDKNWTAARRTLDSVRDMFGLRSAINVNLNMGNQMPADAYADLSEMQLEALAMLDAPSRTIDVPSIERSVELAGVALDVVAEGMNGNGKHDD